jgi:hypothetical protein
MEGFRELPLLQRVMARSTLVAGHLTAGARNCMTLGRICPVADNHEESWATGFDNLDRFQGHFLRSISFAALRDEDSLDITLFSDPRSPGLVIKAEGIYHFSTSKPESLTGMFVDEFSLRYIPKTSAAWPDGIGGNLGPRPGTMPDLFWLQIIGPAEIHVVARFLTFAVSKP